MSNNEIAKKIIVALDVDSPGEARELIEQLGDTARSLKVGFQLFTSAGPDIAREIKKRDKFLFLDLKFHDIPNTVARASEVAVELGVDMFNVHISGGMEMMRAAAEAARLKAAKMGVEKPIILGVTILTSIDSPTLRGVFSCSRGLQDQIVYMASLARSAGLDGVVASPKEIRAIRSTCGDDFVIVTPGVRPKWAALHDQKRTMTPADALTAGADYVVIGRPIRQAKDPADALKKIIQNISG